MNFENGWHPKSHKGDYPLSYLQVMLSLVRIYVLNRLSVVIMEIFECENNRNFLLCCNLQFNTQSDRRKTAFCNHYIRILHHLCVPQIAKTCAFIEWLSGQLWITVDKSILYLMARLF